MIKKELEKYVQAHTMPEDEVLAGLNRQTHLKVMHPNMLSGHLQGRVLYMLVQMIRPQFVLEIGTYTGYSAICMAQALPEGGKVLTIDHNDEIEKFARTYFEKAAVNHLIDFRVGDALEIISNLEQAPGLVFIDADKPQYIDYYEAILPKMKPGSFLIADNVLWYEKVIAPPHTHDSETQAIVAFNRHVHADKRVENVLFPIRDGLMVMRKC